MVNPIFRAYEKFDDGMMYLANKAVRAYNRTTGGTKADLADKIFLTSGAIGGLVYLDPISSPTMTAGNLILYKFYPSRKNHEIELKEQEAAKRNTLDLWVENEKDSLKIAPPSNLIIGGILTPFCSSDKGRLSLYIFLSGIIANSYIMRADYQKPRKTNAWQRAKRKYGRKIRDFGKSLIPEPIPQPELIPVRIPANYSSNNLEELF